MGLNPECKWTEEALAQRLGAIQQRVNTWISDIRALQRAGRDIIIIRLKRLACPPSFWRGWTQEQIAEVMGKDRSVISRIVQNTKFGEMHNFMEQGKDMAWIADHYHIEIPLTWALCLEKKTDQERFEELGWRLGLHEHPESFRVGTHMIEYIGISTTY